MIPLLVDFHHHCLPAMDDGAKDVNTSLQMLDLVKKQGAAHVVATPHFYIEQETPENFIRRRKEAAALLSQASTPDQVPVILGAEVRVRRDLFQKDLHEMTVGKTNTMLLELPMFCPYQSWMGDEIENITYTFQVRPVIAHLDRWIGWYRKEDFQTVFSFDDAVFQLNASALSHRHGRKLAVELAENGYAILLGSDAHNMEDRRPDFDGVEKWLLHDGKGKKILQAANQTATELGLF